MKLHMNDNNKSGLSLKPLDETEAANIQITDDILNLSKITAYNVGQTIQDPNSNKEIPVNPKKFPTKAIDIIFPIKQLFVEIYFDPNSKKWDSKFKYKNRICKLSPDQMEQFFNTQFYEKLLNKFYKEWPLTDRFYKKLYLGLLNKEMKIVDDITIEENNDKSLTNKDVDNDGVRDYTSSGRKIQHFHDNGIKVDTAKFFCWPNKEKVFNWSAWKDWKKIKPLCRLRVEFNGIPYGLTLSVVGGDERNYKNRGFRGYSLDETLPPVQWLSKEEMESFMKLSIVNKFVRHCADKIEKYLKIDSQEILNNINNPEKITIEDIELTKSKIRKTLQYIIKNKQIDSFKWI